MTIFKSFAAPSRFIAAIAAGIILLAATDGVFADDGGRHRHHHRDGTKTGKKVEEITPPGVPKTPKYTPTVRKVVRDQRQPAQPVSGWGAKVRDQRVAPKIRDQRTEPKIRDQRTEPKIRDQRVAKVRPPRANPTGHVWNSSNSTPRKSKIKTPKIPGLSSY